VHTLVATLHGANNTAPGIHDTLAQSNDIIDHLVWAIGASGDGSGLLQHLGHNGEVGLKVPANGASNVAEALKNGWLELIGKGRALKRRLG
jgi:hypothetical protein